MLDAHMSLSWQTLERFVVSLAVCFALVPAGLPAQQPPPPACDRYQAALRADANDLEAAASLGRCSFRDYEMIAPGGDSSRLSFRSSWTTALRALRHAVDNIAEARVLAARWATVAPNDRRPHEYLGQALLRLDDPPAAADGLERAASLGDAASRRNLFWGPVRGAGQVRSGRRRATRAR